MYKYENIKTIHLEITQNCQASCPMCARNQNGASINPHINLDELTLEDCKQIFLVDFIKQLNVMFMCGNLGDPIISRDALEVFKYFREHNSTMWLSMNTNGGARDVEWWTELAKTFNNNGMVIFSVDGLEDTNHLYRQNVNWNIVLRNMEAFISAGGIARWDFLVFDHNQHQVEEAELLSKKMGFKSFTAKKSARFLTSQQLPKEKQQALNRNGKKTLEIKKPNVEYQNNAVKTQEIIANKYGSMKNYHDTVSIKCKVEKEASLFVSAEGLVLPCCWTAGRLYRWWLPDPKIEQIWKYIDNVGGKDSINAKKNGLAAVFETGIFEDIKNSWSLSSCANGKLQVCATTCGVEFDPYMEQFK